MWLVSPGIAGISHPDFPVNTVSPGIAGILYPDFPVNTVSPGIRSLFLADFPASSILIGSEKNQPPEGSWLECVQRKRVLNPSNLRLS